MAIKPLAELDDFDLVNSDQDCRGWVVVDAAGKRLGEVKEMLVDTNTEFVTALVLASGEQIPARNITLKDKKVVVRGMDTRGTATPDAAPRTAGEGEVVVPVIEEQIKIGKRAVERGGVRVTTKVTEKPVEKTVTLRDETVRVDRRPVNREVSQADVEAVREGTIEVTAKAEEAVVAKQARVVEEVVIDKDVQERTETVRDTVRRTDVEVEKLAADATAKGKSTKL